MARRSEALRRFAVLLSVGAAAAAADVAAASVPGEASRCAAAAAGDAGPGGPAREVELCGLAGASAAEGLDGEGLRMLQRRGSYHLDRPSAVSGGAPPPPPPLSAAAVIAVPKASTEAQAAAAVAAPPAFVAQGPVPWCPPAALRPLARWDVLRVAAWTWPERRSPEALFAAAAFFSTLPAVVAYGLPVLISRGTAQVSAVAAFWCMVLPAARSMQAAQQRHASLPPGSCPDAEAVAVSHAAVAIAAHFYWMWGLLELVVRRKPLAQRIAGAAALGGLVLPIPWAQVLLRDLSPLEAAQDSLLGSTLGLSFFLFLHLPVVWRALKAGKGPVTDNLTTFWGGAVWPPERGLRQKQLVAAPDEAPGAGGMLGEQQS
mmetsp:Transcript_14551/g.46613  ORF Transcript_14551/g.46613 Transcript_14551/m.46613 type:complete len:374 (+) Transcript_14551:153-1274(+)|eukprot:CAMPEP_0175686296 /NCGR_PEP_ID=MMETSP0097-20121207/27795_1 /TAXON_ID=311494 /ORGANISM="Alexandrium monilatum, Strain CCMP3105" /LENGTH=373 /DNA_ID=CAMNT_0016993283 /DNA_START=164 /DNA_END=1285 /DNA_ORIENTATION=-